MANKHGLSREIPEEVKREVRRRSKFGCVICRSGVFQYEHIDPVYEDAFEHNADNICCLCGSCHDKVSRRHYSKSFVKKAYLKCDLADGEISAPFDFIDFSEGKAELKIGGINYEPGVECIFRYHGSDIISIRPGGGDVPGGIDALFFDDDGRETLKIDNNVWRGSIGSWDTEVVGPRISVRKKKGIFSLKLRLDPPGRVVVEHLDMRFEDAHILISEQSHALGRYIEEDKILWMHSTIVSMGAPLARAAAIEYLTRFEIEYRDQAWSGRGNRMATADNQMVMQTGLGVTYKPLGIIVGSHCLRFGMGPLAVGGPHSLALMRKHVFHKPDSVPGFIAVAKSGQKKN